jgi:hypothetical protein
VAADRNGLRHTPVQARLLDHFPISRRATFEADVQIADSDQEDLMLVVLRGTVRVSMLAVDGRDRVLGLPTRREHRRRAESAVRCAAGREHRGVRGNPV